MARILLLKFGAIGDVIMAIPAAHEMHRQGFDVDWVCGRTVLPLLQLYPWITPIVIDDRALLTGSLWAKLRVLANLWRTLFGRRYDVVATLYFDRRYRLLATPVRAGRRIMLSHGDRRFCLLSGRHHTDEFARILLGLPDEVRPQALAPVRPISLPPSPLPRAQHGRVILAPAGARNMLADDALRRWQPENYAALASLLLARGLEVVLIGSESDRWIRPHFASLAVVDVIGEHTLPETLALLDAGDVLVTHDTGPLHMGGITAIGIVALFGPTDPRGRLPQREGTVAIWGGEGFACRPCYDGHSFAPCPANECMTQITPTMVEAEVLHLLQTRADGRSVGPRVVTPPSTLETRALVSIATAASVHGGPE